MKESPLGRRGETNVGGHKLVGMNIGVNFDAALLFPDLQMPPTPLKMRLEKRDMVVESMICKRSIHFGHPHRRLSAESTRL